MYHLQLMTPPPDSNFFLDVREPKKPLKKSTVAKYKHFINSTVAALFLGNSVLPKTPCIVLDWTWLIKR